MVEGRQTRKASHRFHRFTRKRIQRPSGAPCGEPPKASTQRTRRITEDTEKSGVVDRASCPGRTGKALDAKDAKNSIGVICVICGWLPLLFLPRLGMDMPQHNAHPCHLCNLWPALRGSSMRPGPEPRREIATFRPKAFAALPRRAYYVSRVSRAHNMQNRLSRIRVRGPWVPTKRDCVLRVTAM